MSALSTLPTKLQIYTGSYSHSSLMENNKQIDKEKSWGFGVFKWIKMF